MKKLIGLMFGAMLAVGSFAMADPTTPACDAPIDVDCNIDEDTHCDLYISVPEGGLSVCEDGLA